MMKLKKLKKSRKKNNIFMVKISAPKGQSFRWAKKQKTKTTHWVLLLVSFVIALSVFVGYWLFEGNASLESWSKIVARRETEKIRRYIDGVWVDRGRENLYPVAVMVENMVDGRPQSAIEKASLVWEAQSEAGITRFLAIYATAEELAEIGPVRSARPYYIDWAGELAALYVHVGGSPEALRLIYNERQALNLNQFYEYQYFWRSKERQAPHNVYTSSEFLNKALADKKAPLTGAYQPWLFKDDQPVGVFSGKALTIEFAAHYSPLYRVEWHYDQAANDYLRYQDDDLHLTADKNEIRAKNVVVFYTDVMIIDQIGRRHIKTAGTGKAVIFQDGRIIEGSWRKQARDERTRFYAIDGQEIVFNAGSTWIEVVPSKNNNVEYEELK